VALAANLVHHRFAAVHADSHLGPLRMLDHEPRELALQGECGACSAEGVVRLVSAAVERRDDASPMNFSISPPWRRVSNGAAMLQ